MRVDCLAISRLGFVISFSPENCKLRCQHITPFPKELCCGKEQAHRSAIQRGIDVKVEDQAVSIMMLTPDGLTLFTGAQDPTTPTGSDGHNSCTY
jgi:hypothetical protein